MYTSKRKCHHFDVIIMTGGTESGTIDNCHNSTRMAPFSSQCITSHHDINGAPSAMGYHTMCIML